MADKPNIFADFSFYGDLSDLFPVSHPVTTLRLEFAPHQTVKHLVEIAAHPAYRNRHAAGQWAAGSSLAAPARRRPGGGESAGGR